MKQAQQFHNLYPSLRALNIEEWRNWLENNCENEKLIWLIVYHKSSKTPSIHWHDAIENALCYGWVDSLAKKRDKESCYLKFTPRNPKSNWGKRSKERAIKMMELNLMTEHGLKLINIAKENGKWDKTE
ncbi:MAG: hypothetical protein R2771_09695 [Saprospiraceae bacterium]